MKRPLSTILVFISALFLFGSLFAQTSDTKSLSDSTSLSVSGCESSHAKVLVNTSVKGQKTNSYVTTLTSEKFRLTSDGQTLSLQCFSRTDQPILVGFVLDYSSSTAKSTTKVALEAIEGFIEESNPQNAYFVVGFTDEPFVLLQPTSDRKKIDAFLQQSALRERSGKTALNDAIMTAFDTLPNDGHPRRMLVIISDGQDTNSRTTNDKLLKRIRGSNVRVFSAGVVDPPNSRTIVPLAGEGKLLRLASETGGTVTKETLGAYFKRLAKNRRAEYLLGFSPTEVEAKWRPLKFEIKVPKDFEQISIVGIERFYY